MTEIRPAKFEDYSAIESVCNRNSMSLRPYDDFVHLWKEFPNRTEFADLPIGWVLQGDGGNIVGTFSNVWFSFEWKREPLRACVAGAWAVDSTHRRSSLALGAKFFGQRNVDLLINGSASSTAARLMSFYGMSRLPVPEVDLHYIWITDFRRFAGGALRKLNAPAVPLLSVPLGLVLRLRALLHNRSSYRPSRNVISVRGFDESFDEFWQRQRCRTDRLLAVRSSAMLSWRFKYELLRDRAVILAALAPDSSLEGYVVLVQHERPHLALTQYLIADLQVLEESSPDVTHALIVNAISAACSAGCHFVEWVGSNEAKRAAAKQLAPHPHKNPVWQYYYRAADSLREDLKQVSIWDPSLYEVF